VTVSSKENPLDAPLKWGPFLLSLCLMIAGQVYTTGVRDTKQAQTDAIVLEMRSEAKASAQTRTEREQIGEVRFAQSQDFQSSTKSLLTELMQRVITIEHSRR
jgi:hypothetical protein